MLLYCTVVVQIPRKIQEIPNQEFDMESLNLSTSYILILKQITPTGTLLRITSFGRCMYVWATFHFLAMILFYFYLQIPHLKQNVFHKRFKNVVDKNSESYSVSV